MPDVALKEYFERRLHDLEIRFEQSKAYADRAIEKAETSVDKRLTAMNEFRDALKDQAATMATQAQLHAFRENVERQLSTRREFVDTQIDRLADRMVMTEKKMAVQVAVASLVATVVSSIVTALVIKWMQ